MIEHPNVIPIAVVVAVAVFLAREALDGWRRFRTNSRKLRAIRKLIAADCERNNYAIGSILGQVADIDAGLKNASVISIERTVSGLPRLAIREPDKEFGSSSPVPPLHTGNLEKYLFEAASLDRTLFDLMEQALDGLAEARHVREGIIEYVSEDTAHLGSFADFYAPRELNKSLEGLRNLYANCTGEPLAASRVR
ncbi:MAG TPA: hypothetical protein VE891_02100 [Allosphingosinicella sp.]|nr:hypothetical protein [Allosphingosinicella sp.]